MNPKPQGFLKAAIKLKLEQPNLFVNDFFDGNNSFQPVSGGEFSFRCLGKSDKGTECISVLVKVTWEDFYGLLFGAPESSHITGVSVA